MPPNDILPLPNRKIHVMYSHIRGELISKSPNRAVIEAGGIGYDVKIPLSTYSSLGELSSRTMLLLVLVVKEDSMSLFGFASPEEKEMFQDLTSVSGVGPTTALLVLSSMGVHDIAAAISAEDAGKLQKIKGIGSKTASQIVLDLKGKMKLISPSERPEPASVSSPYREEGIAALMSLGFSKKEATERANAVEQSGQAATLEEYISLALKSALK